MTTLVAEERELARSCLRRFSNGELSPAELAIEIERWEQHRALLTGDLRAQDFAEHDAGTLAAGIAYVDLRLAELERQAKRVLRAGVSGRALVAADFDRAKYADLVGLAETITASPAVRSGNGRYRILCPFHDDTKPSLVIYPPGGGWWCPVCGRGGQDAASFCAEYFHCSQLEGLRFVEQLCDLVGAA